MKPSLKKSRDFTVAEGHGHPLVCLKYKEKIINPSNPISLIDDDFGITFELSLFTSNIIK
jgi:hypothetical protein